MMELIGEGHEIDSIPCVSEPRTIDEADRTARLIREYGKLRHPVGALEDLCRWLDAFVSVLRDPENAAAE